MKPVFGVAAIREAEEAAFALGEPARSDLVTFELVETSALMLRAASGLAGVIDSELRRAGTHRAEVLIAAGPGNNGGDALWAGAMLARRGVGVSVWRTAGTAHMEGWAALQGAGGVEVDAISAIRMLGEVDLVVDGVLGIGGRGGLPEGVGTFARACRDVGVRVVAVDLPSGLEGDSGEVSEAFTADVTVTFGGYKPCLVMEPAASRCGCVELVDIGLEFGTADMEAWDESDVAARWPFPGPMSDKYSRGVVGIDAGSVQYPGAAVLSCLGASYAGAGMVRYIGAARDAVISALPNIVLAEGRVQSYVIGSGWGERLGGESDVAGILATGIPAVVDAEAIGMLPRHRLGERVLLTPHAGELARLLGVSREEVVSDPVSAVREAAASSGAVVLLKGASQYVATPAGRVTLAVPGPAWTAQAGSGDVLAGTCGALLAAGLGAREAALAGASVQALAARATPGPIPPQDLARRFPEIIAAWTGQPTRW
jgi:hydroxyethylthiazole kinase-like uncharacterized protein yjeF